MAILHFSDILVKAGLNPERVKLIRHSLRDQGFKACYEKGMIFEYTCHQKVNFSKNYDYWVVFISEKSTQAKLYACYKVIDFVPDTPDIAPNGFPDCERCKFQGNHAYYHLEHVDFLKEYEKRLIIDWGNATIAWHQKGSTDKPVLAIREYAGRPFLSYEEVVLSYGQLKEIIETENEDEYAQWHTALSKINAIYLIVDTTNGQQYVGSAYGDEGLWGRWACYVSSRHGNNKDMKAIICKYPERYHKFQFSILQVLPKTLSPDEVIRVEGLYKKKLLSFPFGMNEN